MFVLEAEQEGGKTYWAGLPTEIADFPEASFDEILTDTDIVKSILRALEPKNEADARVRYSSVSDASC